MTTLLAFIFAIAILVVIHELGHYVVARWCDVKVLRFSVGFGKVLYSRRFGNGETEWVISAVPLGGYVKMLDEHEGEVPEQDLPRAFNRKPVLQRMAIVVAGPISNLLLAVVMYFALFVHGVPGIKPVLGEVAADTPAAAAGLQSGQTIVAVNGQATPSWQDVRWVLIDLVLLKEAATLEMRTAQDERMSRVLEMGSLTPADLDSDFMQKLGLHLYQPPVYPVIGRLVPGGVAEQAGLQVNDRILLANGQKMSLWEDWVEIVRANPGKTMDIEVERAGVTVKFALAPEVVDEGDKRIGRIGAAAHIDRAEFEAMLTEVRYPPIEAMQEALRKTWETAVLSLKMMGKMVVGEVSLKNLSGPITIADYAGQSAQMGLGAYIGFLALISISLGVLNLLPIPLLDGGHLLYYSVELLKGSPVPESLWEIGQRAGIALLVTMMAFALYNDISRLISG
ncbi:MAG: RIP metalloprotease RseP [Gammaproteobacteria bacterium]|nr:RIP metalloprotease RseP [Gammaproteobacteria bacterium]MBU1777552.1 RIP metalloprotease RseP [Gammaproteobacteria bacterium]MBU1968764.1 RIP metalloprotease RseP [Gammaproteobacteria bacterium]